jgi:hypothetical protein
MSKNNTVLTIFTCAALIFGIVGGGCVSGKGVSYQKPFQNGEKIAAAQVNTNDNFQLPKYYNAPTPARKAGFDKKGAELLMEKDNNLNTVISLKPQKTTNNIVETRVIVETSPWIRLAMFYLSILCASSVVMVYLIYRKLFHVHK